MNLVYHISHTVPKFHKLSQTPYRLPNMTLMIPRSNWMAIKLFPGQKEMTIFKRPKTLDFED